MQTESRATQTDGGMALQAMLVARLAGKLASREPRVQRYETHISWVITAGDFAYKIKKAVCFGFLDFTSLAARRHFCEEELRLNRRTAAQLYIDVVPVTGTPEDPCVGGEDEVIEYVLRMHAFKQEALWTHRLSRSLVSGEEIDELADRLAAFHESAARAPVDAPWGSAQTIAANVDETVASLAELVPAEGQQSLDELCRWEKRQRQMLENLFAKRKTEGMVRECHGDLHVGNILTSGQGVEIFDCIEFNDALRWIDVMNDLAFVCMDLEYQQQGALAWRLLNRYLETSGDYDGLAVWQYYRVHRALVRCKISLLRVQQAGVAGEEAVMFERQGLSYLSLAARCAAPGHPAILLTHGYSGCGKTSFARRMAQCFHLIQIRSDVERKRMHGLRATDRPGSTLYDSKATENTYLRLRTLARSLLALGIPVIVDAAFLQAWQRNMFAGLAAEMHVPFLIFDIQTGIDVMRRRIARRTEDNRDASDAAIATLEMQLQTAEPLSDKERACAIVVDAESDEDPVRNPVFRGRVAKVFG